MWFTKFLRFHLKHADCELMDMLEKIAPPPELERVAIFKAAVMRFQESVGDPNLMRTQSQIQTQTMS